MPTKKKLSKAITGKTEKLVVKLQGLQLRRKQIIQELEQTGKELDRLDDLEYKLQNDQSDTDHQIRVILDQLIDG